LKRLGVADCAGERWESLTDGEHTLVALAHALVREPRVLVADDPTANLNVLQREEVVGLFGGLQTRKVLLFSSLCPTCPTRPIPTGSAH